MRGSDIKNEYCVTVTDLSRLSALLAYRDRGMIEAEKAKYAAIEAHELAARDRATLEKYLDGLWSKFKYGDRLTDSEKATLDEWVSEAISIGSGDSPIDTRTR